MRGYSFLLRLISIVCLYCILSILSCMQGYLGFLHLLATENAATVNKKAISSRFSFQSFGGIYQEVGLQDHMVIICGTSILFFHHRCNIMSSYLKSKRIPVSFLGTACMARRALSLNRAWGLSCACGPLSGG